MPISMDAGLPVAAAQPGRRPERPYRGGVSPTPPPRARGRARLDAQLLELLSMDGRMSLRALSAATDACLTTVRRRLQSVLTSRLNQRRDPAQPGPAQPLSGWPLSAVCFASVPGQ
ncbi:hypothetical protein ACFYO2_09310 [Streptomyces sp. NPDC006602]|uniref:hypothetical protein n=1 Tax=Streptomyces sp. NPDC006602 TaxID=3364751 RepID=UPI0036981F5B